MGAFISKPSSNKRELPISAAGDEGRLAKVRQPNLFAIRVVVLGEKEAPILHPTADICIATVGRVAHRITVIDRVKRPMIPVKTMIHITLSLWNTVFNLFGW